MEWKPSAGNLEESQRAIIRDCLTALQGGKQTYKMPWVSGFAGNGKSVVLVHTMEQLADLNKSASIVFVTYTHALKDLIQSSLLPRHRGRIVVKTHTAFISDKVSVDFVFLDEVQDISKADLIKINNLTGAMVLAGDFSQSIYPTNKPIELADLTSSFKVQEHRLLKMFRLTKKLAQIVSKLLPRGSFTAGEPVRQEEVPPRLFKFDSTEEEFKWLWEEVKLWVNPRTPAVILVPFHKDIAQFIEHVSEVEGMGNPPTRDSSRFRNGEKVTDPYGRVNEFFAASQLDVTLQVFGSGSGVASLAIADSKKVVLLMTYHSVKGLDFESVFIPMLDHGKKLYPGKENLETDPEIERKLLFVAMTRSRRNLFLSFATPQPHLLVQGLGLQPLTVDDNDSDY